jgi:hypothetical protein
MAALERHMKRGLLAKTQSCRGILVENLVDERCGVRELLALE